MIDWNYSNYHFEIIFSFRCTLSYNKLTAAIATTTIIVIITKLEFLISKLTVKKRVEKGIDGGIISNKSAEVSYSQGNSKQF